MSADRTRLWKVQGFGPIFDTFLYPSQYIHFGHTCPWGIELALDKPSEGPCWESCPSAISAALTACSFFSEACGSCDVGTTLLAWTSVNRALNAALDEGSNAPKAFVRNDANGAASSGHSATLPLPSSVTLTRQLQWVIGRVRQHNHLHISWSFDSFRLLIVMAFVLRSSLHAKPQVKWQKSTDSQ